ncbi:hypothetical protein FB446DRAFT_720137 [Lentinula raphanica]|nr:hypothetical protein FB446DRAFT_720137 [Lentinula raphanica]
MRDLYPFFIYLLGVFTMILLAAPCPAIGDCMGARGPGVKPYFVKPVFGAWSGFEPPRWLVMQDDIRALFLQDARDALKLPAGAIMDYTSEHSYPAHNGKDIYDPIEFTVNGDGCKGKRRLITLGKAVCDVQADPKALRERVTIKDAGGNIIFSKGTLKWKETNDSVTMGF